MGGQFQECLRQSETVCDFVQKGACHDRQDKGSGLLRTDVEGLSSRSIAAVIARLASRFFCFASEPADAQRVIRRLCMFASGEESGVGALPARALPKYFELSSRGAHVFDQCGLVLGAFMNRNANEHHTTTPGAKLSERLLAAIGARSGFDASEGGESIERAVSDDLAAAGRVGDSSLDAPDASVDPSERGPLGILWRSGPPKWWRPAA